MMTEVGSASISEAEGAKLRDYLLKGGFLWADDFWGNYAWQWWEAQLRRVLPADQYPIVELPRDHPLFHSQVPGAAHAADRVDQLLGRAAAATPRSAAPTAPKCTRARFSTTRAASWC